MSDANLSSDDVKVSGPLVTAVLVCWNHVRFVRQAVLSAIQQSYENVEIVIFDNGSTDGSRQVLEEMAREFDFTLVCQENIGAVRTLNLALSQSAGKYFTMVATDDIWLPEKIERQVRFLEANPDVHMVCGNKRDIDENGCEIVRDGNFQAGEITYQKLIRNKCWVFGPTVMCRTEILRRVGGYDEKVRIEDLTLALRFTRLGHRVVCLDEVCTLYRRHGGNWTAVPIIPECLAIGRAYCDSVDYVTYVRAYAHFYFRWLAGRNKREAVRLLRQEPIAWTWDDVGVGIIKLMLPKWLMQWRQ